MCMYLSKNPATALWPHSCQPGERFERFTLLSMYKSHKADANRIIDKLVSIKYNLVATLAVHWLCDVCQSRLKHKRRRWMSITAVILQGGESGLIKQDKKA